MTTTSSFSHHKEHLSKAKENERRLDSGESTRNRVVQRVLPSLLWNDYAWDRCCRSLGQRRVITRDGDDLHRTKSIQESITTPDTACPAASIGGNRHTPHRVALRRISHPSIDHEAESFSTPPARNNDLEGHSSKEDRQSIPISARAITRGRGAPIRPYGVP